METVELVRDRLGRAMESWPGVIRQALNTYSEGSGSDFDQASDVLSLDKEEPYWLLLPRWLSVRLHDQGLIEDPDGALLRDALFSQYCLFLAIRVEDDLFDDQASDSSLRAVPGQLLDESDRALGRQFSPDSPIWPLRESFLRTTRVAIAAIDKLQRIPGGMSGDALVGYSKVSEVLKVGTAAICMSGKRMCEFSAVSAFCDHLAIAGQIVDDLEDLREDFERDRYNYACNTLLQLSDSCKDNPKLAREVLARSFALGDGIHVLLGEVKNHLEQASAAVAALDLPQLEAYCEQAIRELDQYWSLQHRARVSFLFGRGD